MARLKETPPDSPDAKKKFTDNDSGGSSSEDECRKKQSKGKAKEQEPSGSTSKDKPLESYAYEKSEYYEKELPRASRNDFTFYDNSLLYDSLQKSKCLEDDDDYDPDDNDFLPPPRYEECIKYSFMKPDPLRYGNPGYSANHSRAEPPASLNVFNDPTEHNERVRQQKLQASKEDREVRPKVSSRYNNMAEYSSATVISNNEAEPDDNVQVIVTPSVSRKARSRRYFLCALVTILSVFIGCMVGAFLVFGKHTDEQQMQSTLINYKDSSIRQVVILFRHGERTPTETYDNDPHKNYPWKGGWGVLTKKGMKRMHRLGQWINDRYGWLNEGNYNHSNTYVQSSYSDRCIESSQALLSGLYPVSPEDAFVKGLLWKPIPVHSTPRNLDKIIVVKYPCKELRNLLSEAYRKTNTLEMLNYLDDLTLITGNRMNNITSVEFLYNTLEIEVAEGLKLPETIQKYYEDPRMLEIARQSLAIFTHGQQQKRLLGGPLLNNILNNMEDFNKGLKNDRIHLYGVHDITLVNLLRTMGIEKFNDSLLKPGLGATLIFELIQKDPSAAATVRLLYMDDSSVERVNPLTIPACSKEECKDALGDTSLNSLRKNYINVIPEDWDIECTGKDVLPRDLRGDVPKRECLRNY